MGQVYLDGLLSHGSFVHPRFLSSVAGFGADLEAGSSGLCGKELSSDGSTAK